MRIADCGLMKGSLTLINPQSAFITSAFAFAFALPEVPCYDLRPAKTVWFEWRRKLRRVLSLTHRRVVAPQV
jgi:hypothetical protein